MIGRSMMMNQLVDMEWSFGGTHQRSAFDPCDYVSIVTAANNDLAQVGTTFLQLKLVLDKGHGQKEVVPMGTFEAALLCDVRA